jgi:hypothetical protein
MSSSIIFQKDRYPASLGVVSADSFQVITAQGDIYRYKEEEFFSFFIKKVDAAVERRFSALQCNGLRNRRHAE